LRVQQLFCQYPRVIFHQGLPELNDFDGKEPGLFITDELINLFNKGSHHRNVSVVYLAQNLFSKKNKFARTMSINAHYMVLFKNLRDATQFANLARQMYPKTSQFAVEAYKDATREPYSYLLIDLSPELFTTANEHISKRDALRVHCQMSRRINKYLPVLKRIAKLGDKAKKNFVRKCDKDFLDCVSECAKNVIKGNVPLTVRQKERLRRSRDDLRAWSVKKTTLRRKRRILQKGGFLARYYL